LNEIERAGSKDGKVRKVIKIDNCGELTKEEFCKYEKPHVHDVLASHH